MHGKQAVNVEQIRDLINEMVILTSRYKSTSAVNDSPLPPYTARFNIEVFYPAELAQRLLDAKAEDIKEFAYW